MSRQSTPNVIPPLARVVASTRTEAVRPFEVGHVTSNIPEDLWMYIFDLIDGDRRTMRACYLTCRSWSLMIGPLLFRNITLTTEAHCERLRRMMNSGLSGYIQNLTLRGIQHHIHDDKTRFFARLSRTVSHLCAPKVHLVDDALQVLHASSPTSTTKRRKQVFAALLPAVQTLELRDFHVATLSDLPVFLSAFPLLQHCTTELTCNHVVTPSRLRPFGVAAGLKQELLSMRFRLLPGELESQWACIVATLRSIKTLCLRQLEFEVHDSQDCDGILPMPFEDLDEQLVRIHSQCSNITILFQIIRIAFAGSKAAMPQSYNPTAVIASRLTNLRASGARPLCQIDIDLGQVRHEASKSMASACLYSFSARPPIHELSGWRRACSG